MKHTGKSAAPCCPKFEGGPWDGKTLEWADKAFIMDTIPQLLHMPFPPMYSRKISRMWRQVSDAGAAPDMKDFLLLAYDPSPWKSELYLAVTRKVPGARNVTLSGTFYSRVFDGPYNAVPKWLKEMGRQIADRGRTADRYYVHYTTCPRCAREYGHNYAVVLARLR